MNDFNLERFLTAQEGSAFYSSFDVALHELEQGKKQSHWMWYIFPQIRGLGKSRMSLQYAISGRNEARAYLDHPLLGERLRQVCEVLIGLPSNSARDIFGQPDDKKLRSSMTLFAAVSESDNVFTQVLDKFFNGERDYHTIQRLRGEIISH